MTEVTTNEGQGVSLVEKIADRYGVQSNRLLETLKMTAFKQRDGSAPTNEQMMALLVVADQYRLNPFTKEIYAFPDKNNGIIPIVGADGWSRIINNHPQMDGLEFNASTKMVKMPGSSVECPEWIETVIYRKDRAHPIKIKEYLDEVYRKPFEGKGRNGSYTIEGPWQTHTKRMLRWKSMIQGSRVGFGFTGIYDHDEAERIQEVRDITPQAGGSDVQHLTHQANTTLAEEKKAAMQPILDQLVSRAIAADGAWSAAQSYVSDRFNGSEQAYAVDYLRDAEIEQMPSEALELSADEATSEEAAHNDNQAGLDI